VSSGATCDKRSAALRLGARSTQRRDQAY
jgi:hypothetical protein